MFVFCENVVKCNAYVFIASLFNKKNGGFSTLF